MRILLAILLIAIAANPLLAAGRPMTVEDLMAVKGVSDPQISPDGSLVVYVVTELDQATQKNHSSLWLVPAAGGESKQLTTAAGTNNHPRFSTDGKSIAFVSSRGGSSQVWLIPIDGGEAHQLTKLPIDASGPIWSPQGDKIAFAAEVYPGLTPEQTAAKDKEKESSKKKVRIYDRLMIRHWNAWDEGKRSHLFVADAKSGVAHDLTPKLEVNTPPAPFGGSSDYAWSPDGKELAFTAEPATGGAWSTNTDIWTVPVEGGDAKNLTEANQGADAQPAYSPDGRWLAYVSQARAGFESDQWILTLLDRKTGGLSHPTKALDRPVQSFTWDQSQPRTIIAAIDHDGTVPIIGLPINEDGTSRVDPKRTRAIRAHERAERPRRSASRPRGAAWCSSEAGLLSRLSSSELSLGHYRSVTVRPAPARLTDHNAALVAELDLQPAESFEFSGADGDRVQGWLVRPPGFDPAKKYPVVFLIHGGPQGAWHDEWHNRWNYGMFAAPGYAVVAINPRGSTGFGQKFTDQISQDWTGRVYED